MNISLFKFENEFNELINLYEKNNFPKVLMLSGEKGQGKSTLIFHLMSFIIDNSNYSKLNRSLKATNKLYSGIKENLIPNVIYLSGEDKSIKIEKIRDLRSELQKTTLDNKPRYIILDDVELINKNCINALLKILEEPTVVNYFILINNKTRPIIDTIKSRCIEKKIFLKISQRKEIILNLIDQYNIDTKIDYESLHLTPGLFFTFNDICNEANISIDDDLIDNTNMILKLFKVKKEIKYVNFLKYLINYYFYKILKTKKDIINIYEKQISTIKLVDNFYDFNLNSKNFINEIENYIK